MAKREEATPETNPRAESEEGPAPTVAEESEADRELESDQEALQTDSS